MYNGYKGKGHRNLLYGYYENSSFLKNKKNKRTWSRVTLNNYHRRFPGGAVVKNPPANVGDTGSSPGPGRSHMPRSN